MAPVNVQWNDLERGELCYKISQVAPLSSGSEKTVREQLKEEINGIAGEGFIKGVSGGERTQEGRGVVG